MTSFTRLVLLTCAIVLALLIFHDLSAPAEPPPPSRGPPAAAAPSPQPATASAEADEETPAVTASRGAQKRQWEKRSSSNSNNSDDSAFPVVSSSSSAAPMTPGEQLRDLCRRNCFDHRCMLPALLENGDDALRVESLLGCVPSRYSTSASGDSSDPDALPAMIKDRDESAMFAWRAAASSSRPVSPLENLNFFKKATRGMFSNWTDWLPQTDASSLCPILPAATNVDARTSAANIAALQPPSPPPVLPSLRGAHLPNGGPYRLENFCLRPSGRLAGFAPQMGEFWGGTEAHGANDEAPEEGMRKFVSDVEALDDFHYVHSRFKRRAPPCFLDKPRLLLFPITTHSDNPGHSLYRTGSLLRFIEKHFGNNNDNNNSHSNGGGGGGGGDVTVVYVVTSKAPKGRSNAMGFFYRVVGASHFSVEYSPFAMSTANSPMQCFRSALVWQDVHVKKAKRWLLDHQQRQQQNPQHGDNEYPALFPLFGPRGPREVETVRLLNRVLRAQHGLAPRRAAPNRAKPHVVLCVRSVSRKLTLQALLIRELASSMLGDGAVGTLEVVENAHLLSLRQIIEVHSRADVLIGMLGAGLIWTHFMPPGAVLVEINARGYRCATVSGVDKNGECDFGGAAKSSEQHHVALATQFEPLLRFPYAAVADAAAAAAARTGADEQGSSELQHLTRGQRQQVLESRARRAVGAFDLAVGPATLRFALDRAQCLLSRSVASCDIGQTQVDAAAREDVEDKSGELFAAFFRIVSPTADFNPRRRVAPSSLLAGELARRLAGLVRRRAELSAATLSLRMRSSGKGKNAAATAEHLVQFQTDEEALRTPLDRTLVLLVLACPIAALPRDGSESAGDDDAAASRMLLRQELDGWRNVLQHTHQIMVIDGAACASSTTPTATALCCSGKKRKRSSAVSHLELSPAGLPGVTMLCRYPCREVRAKVDLIVRTAAPFETNDNTTKSDDDMAVRSDLVSRFAAEAAVVIDL